MKEDLQEAAKALHQSEALGDELLDKVDQENKAKRRRQEPAPVAEVKEENENASSEAQQQVRQQHVTYYYPTTTPELRSRKQVEGAGVQKFSQRAQMYLVPDTHDLDIENSLFTMVLQLIQKLDL